MAGACAAASGCGGAGSATVASDASVPPADAHVEDAGRFAACAAYEGPAPHTIADVMVRLDALPQPASTSCFVASLPRPLSVVAVNSRFSAQPANGLKSPRLFLLGVGLVMSVVPSGPGGELLELSEWVTPLRTVKGELAMPSEAPLADSAPFLHLTAGPAAAPSSTTSAASTCGLCHGHEEPSDTYAGAYVTDAFRPSAGTEIPLESVRILRDACRDYGDEAPECALLGALFDYGPVVQGAFAEDLARLF